MTKKRLDVLLVERGMAESREKAQRLIRAGLVHSESQRLEKPGVSIDTDTELFLKGTDCPYVSRGGLKMEGALNEFAHDPTNQVVLDLGASTGGFTDCLLQRGARKVYAIDVGRGQLHNKLLNDERVINREKTHMDTLERTHFTESLDLVVGDLSFISLKRALPVVEKLLNAGKHAILLVKPQFEVGKSLVPKGGVIRDGALQQQVLEELVKHAEETNFKVAKTCDSPITGGDGNREFFLYLIRN